MDWPLHACLLPRAMRRPFCLVPSRDWTAMLPRYVPALTQLDALARGRLQHDGETAQGPLACAFACDMLQQDTIYQAFADIQATWPDRLIGTCAYNGSIRKRGEFLQLNQRQLKDSIDASVYVSYGSTAALHSSHLPSSPSERWSSTTRAARCLSQARPAASGAARDLCPSPPRVRMPPY